MIPAANTLERRLRFSGILLIVGLLVEAVCLFWARPASILALIGVGGLLLLLGVIVYLLSLLLIKHPSGNDNP